MNELRKEILDFLVSTGFSQTDLARASRVTLSSLNRIVLGANRDVQFSKAVSVRRGMSILLQQMTPD